jgi:hypothetical protein
VTLEIYDGEKMPPFRSAFGTMSVEADGERTIARLSLDYEMKYGPLGSLMDRFMVRPRFRKMVSSVLAGLKRHIESGNGGDADLAA